MALDDVAKSKIPIKEISMTYSDSEKIAHSAIYATPLPALNCIDTTTYEPCNANSAECIEATTNTPGTMMPCYIDEKGKFYAKLPADHPWNQREMPEGLKIGMPK